MSINEIESKVRELRQLQALTEEATAEAESIKDQIKAHMGDSEELRAGEYKVTWKPVTSSKLDSIVLLRSFRDYFSGYTDEDGTEHPGYEALIQKLTVKFPLSEPQIIGEQNEKDFISLFGAILRMRNILTSFDEFQGCDVLSEQDLQDYLGRYQDLKDEWAERRKKGISSDIDDDIVFEVELIRQVEINIDYILLLVKKYHDSHSEDKEVLITIRKAVDASPELRSKKALIENFISGINDVEDVFLEWRDFVMRQKEQELTAIITEEKLKPEETRQYIETALQAGEIKTRRKSTGVVPQRLER